jgi:hypothetical protein
MVQVMFIRFVSGEIHERSHVSTGLFTAVFDLMYDPILPYDDYCALRSLMDWFSEYLKGPSEYRLRAVWRVERAICWFKPTAHEHLSHAWETAAILERNDVFVRTIKVQRTGYILYEDEAQIFAEPFADIRRVL